MTATKAQTTADLAPAGLGYPRALLLATLLWAVENLLLAAWGATGPDRVLVGLVAAGRTLALGLALAGLSTVSRRLPGVPRWAWRAAGACAAAGAALTVVPEDLAGKMHDRFPRAPELATWVGSVVIGLVPPIAGWVAARLPGRLLRLAAALLAPAIWWLNARILQDGYAGAHLFLGLAGLAGLAGALATARAGAVPSLGTRPARIVLALLAALAAASFWPPRVSVSLQLLQFEGDVVTPFVTRWQVTERTEDAAVPPQMRPWFVRRDETPPIPPTRPGVTPEDPIVILLTIDSLRADVLTDPRAATQLPNLTALRERAVRFTQARAPGSQTVYTLAELFAGTYFSQQFWSPHENIRDLWPDDDEAPRFPELLSQGGVTTVHYPTTRWLVGALGIVRGFQEERFIKAKRTRYVLSTETFPRMFRRLTTHDGGPLFIYTHILDAHYTVSPRKPKAPDPIRYWANLRYLDASIGKLVAHIESLGLDDRVVLIVSSDHGEAFGEHGTRHHRSTLYEELLRVPLFAVIPSVPPRSVDEPVSVIDLGPTILDLFGQPTPGHMMGQSLVPLLAGQDASLTRPIAAEGRLKKAMVFPDGLKAIVDDRHHTEEVYDLNADPAEARNLLDRKDPVAVERVALLRRFFGVHRIRRPGYEIPFRP